MRVRSSSRPGWSLPQLTKRWVIPCEEREERNWEDAVSVSDMVVDEERRKKAWVMMALLSAITYVLLSSL